MDGSMRNANKSKLSTILESGKGVSCPTLPPTDVPTCTLIDGMALIYSIGKTTGASTFGDLADVFIQSVRSNF